ncbi:MAG: ABC transporter ATP-binding protein [Lachnospiraceae bacterium]|nr:ABC transporter ATP-binding protein [Lachnospiraceae bacterium]
MLTTVDFKDVSYKYNTDGKIEKQSLRDVNISIPRGKLIVITGESGCGKTTVGRLINGLSPKFYDGELTGNVNVSGIDPSTSELCETAKVVGSIFQNPRTQFFNVDTTSEITFACENRGLPKEDILKRLNVVVKELDIEKLLNRSIFELSGGEKQKIACASVATADTEVIVMDEPSSNLDLKGIEDLKRVIEKWKAKNKTIIVAEHRLYYLKDLADYLVIMKDGKIIKQIGREEIGNLGIEDLQKLGLRTLSIPELFKAKVERGHSDSGRPSSNYHIGKMIYRYDKEGRGICIKDLDIKSGEVTALIGFNGAGKSTFAKCLSGLNKKCKDEILIDNRRMKCKERVNESFLVMQDVNTQLFADSVINEVYLSLREKYGRKAGEEDMRKEALSILEMMDLSDIKDRHPISLSGGQKQRVAIAGAIAADKKIIIFDEPTSGLDYKHMLEVSKALRMLADMGKVVIVITHDMELIMSAVDRVICMEKGEIADNYLLDDSTKSRLYDYFIH